MKKFIMILLVFVGYNASAQWVVKEVNDDPFEPAYTICYNSATSGNQLFKLEQNDGKILCYISSSYICDEYVDVSMSFKIDDEWERIELTSQMVIKSKLCILSTDLMTEDWTDSLKRASEVAILIKESHCDSERMMFKNDNAEEAILAWSE